MVTGDEALDPAIPGDEALDPAIPASTDPPTTPLLSQYLLKTIYNHQHNICDKQ